MKPIKNAFLIGLALSSICSEVAIATGSTPKIRQVFARVDDWGGVVLQGSSNFFGPDEQAISVKDLDLQIDIQSDSGQRVCLLFEDICYQLDISPETAISLSQWVLTGQIGAYSAWLPETSNPEDELVSVPGGFTPAELAQGKVPEILEFLDFDSLLLNSFDDSWLKEELNASLGHDSQPDPAETFGGSYVNTDIDTDFVTRLADGKAQAEGLLSRYHWTNYEGAEYAYIEEIEQACSPESVKAFNTDQCSVLSDWVDWGYVDQFGYHIDEYWGFEGISLESGEYIAFYLVVDAPAESVMSPSEGYQGDQPVHVLFSVPKANLNDFSPIKSESQEDGLLLKWEDQLIGNDGDFDDLKVKVQGITDSSLISEELDTSANITSLINEAGNSKGVFQLNGAIDTTVYLDFQVLGREAVYVSEFGFFKVDDNEGSINDLRPGDPDYKTAALDRSRAYTLARHSGLRRYYPQKEATELVRAAAIFRRFADENPQELQEFISESQLYSNSQSE
ncbi:hypothetical protein XM38_036510 [Halomicronema hongdechloris C2206]|uniref:DUF4114 domain-containing protein n=1 Tax=Halomicronema hongdechloris C2206 TaxID=1641165 RepID=A0A1Z3HQW0_9CYAN|nr:DUF4114 domain-containing protein [Halomicronema hongdechloris]ASC72693.1 hypothetical protein XM38_036510 [Halomicronema hongdechloris C2206]